MKKKKRKTGENRERKEERKKERKGHKGEKSKRNKREKTEQKVNKGETEKGITKIKTIGRLLSPRVPPGKAIHSLGELNEVNLT
jgi:hypothetical protein